MQETNNRRRSTLRHNGLSRERLSFLRGAASYHSNHHGSRRGSIDFDEVVPFYLKKKYDHHFQHGQDYPSHSRRNSMTLDADRYLIERQLMAPSADLGTVSFKSSGIDRSWLNSDIRREREEAIRRQPETNMELEHKHRPISGMYRFGTCHFPSGVLRPLISNLKWQRRTPFSYFS